jgi:peroxiredoxin
MKCSKVSIVALVACAGLILPAVAGDPSTDKTTTPPTTTTTTSPTNQSKDHQKTPTKGEAMAKVGSIAPDFTLTDTDGKTVTLSDFSKQGKIVVIQWFNPACPFVKKHYDNGANTFNDLAKKYADKGVVFVAINSGAPGREGAGKDTNVAARKDWKIAYPILLDESGKVGKMYNAQHTPEMFVVAKDGTLAYHGAIDEDSGMKAPGKNNYVAKALDELLAGKKVSTAETKPYGCTVKYAN